MATNIDKALFRQPVGVEDDAAYEEPIEIEIVDPEAVNIGIGDTEISITPNEPSIDDFDANLAEFLDDGELATLVSDLDADIENDKNSRKDWEKAYVDGLKLLGLKIEERTQPWNGASGVFHPMLTEAVVRFQSEMITETFPAQGPVRTKILGKDTTQKKEAAKRVENDMNFQLTEVMQEYRPEHERLLWSLPLAGSAFKKVYYDPSFRRQTAMFIPAEDILLPYGASNIEACHRVTHVMRKTKNDIMKLQAAGFYRDVELGEPDHNKEDIQQAKDKETGFTDLNDDRFTLLESHVDLYIKGDPLHDEDEIAIPYVFTYIKGTNTVLAIRRNWQEDDDLRLKRQHFVHYQYIPGFGAYGFGLIHLIGGFANSATSLMRQLIDAGTLANLPGGLKSRGLRIKGDDTPIAPGEFRDVDVGSGVIRDNILPLPYKEPSNTLYQLLNTVVEEGRRFAATADMKVADMSAQAPVGTTLALLERQLKVMSAVQARTHNTLRQEFQLLAAIIRDYTDEDYTYEPDGEEGPRAKKSDYSHVDILPQSDPNAATLSQRVVQYQAAIQMAQMAPEIYDLPQLHRGMLEVLGIKEASKLVPLEEDMKPLDPVTENMRVIKCEPVKAFLYQDHEAHIKVHMAAMQDPIIMQLVGQNPKAPQIQAAATAHIAEHVAFAYRQKIEQQLGMPLPPEGEQLPPEVETAISGMMAQAAQQVLMQNQQMAAQQQAQQQAQDPVLQLQKQELELKAQEIAIKQKKVAVEAAAKADEIDLKRNEIAGKFELEGRKLKANAQQQTARLAADQERDGARMGIDIAKAKAQQRQQALQQARSGEEKPTK